jgi:hypothetical protein
VAALPMTAPQPRRALPVMAPAVLQTMVLGHHARTDGPRSRAGPMASYACILAGHTEPSFSVGCDFKNGTSIDQLTSSTHV